jgi:hypothetical protein
MHRLGIVFVMCACGSTPGPAGPAGPTGPTGPTGDTGPTGFHATTVVVPGSSPTVSGMSLLQAMALAGGPGLIRLEPGTYDLGASTLAMKEQVDIEGSGENVTLITGVGAETVTAAKTAQLRFVAVANSASQGSAVHAQSANGFSLTHVTLSANGAALLVQDDGFVTLDNLSIFVNGAGSGIFCSTSKAGGPNINLRDSAVSVNHSGGELNGLSAAGCNLELDSVDFALSGGSGGSVFGVRIADNLGSPADARISGVIVQADCSGCAATALSLTGGSMAVNADVWSSRLRANGSTSVAVNLTKNGTAAVTAQIADSMLGGTLTSTGTLTCIGDYDSAYAAVTCP